MKRLFVTAICLLSIGLALSPHAQAQDRELEEPETEKIAQTGFKFLSVSVDPRAAAMGDALTANETGGSLSMFYNPAGMARLGSAFHVAGGQTRWIGDINYNAASLAFSPNEGRFGVFGVTFVAVDYGEFVGTIRANNERGYEEYEDLGLSNPSPTALALGFGYARALTDRFAVGGNVKYARQDLSEGVISESDTGFNLSDNSKSTIAVDFGVLYNTGFRSLNFAMSARNFSRELTYAVDNFELPLTFRIGVSMDMMDLTNMDQDIHSLRLALDAERPRDFAEQIKVGTEYVFMNTLALRAGYSYPTDTQGVNLGLGLQQRFDNIGFAFNYAYTTFDLFDNVHRLGLQLSF